MFLFSSKSKLYLNIFIIWTNSLVLYTEIQPSLSGIHQADKNQVWNISDVGSPPIVGHLVLSAAYDATVDLQMEFLQLFLHATICNLLSYSTYCMYHTESHSRLPIDKSLLPFLLKNFGIDKNLILSNCNLSIKYKFENVKLSLNYRLSWICFLMMNRFLVWNVLFS